MLSTTRPSADEIVDRGQAIYDKSIKSSLTTADVDKYIAIEIRSGDYEIGEDHYRTVGILRSRIPDTWICTLRIGYPATMAIGHSLSPNNGGLP